MGELPHPMTPPDCDLRGLPFMPLDVIRLLDSDLFALSTGEEFKAAVALWCKAWTQVPAGSLPDDDRILAHLSGSGARWKKVKGVALRGWIKCSDGRLYHPTVSEKAIEALPRRQEYQEHKTTSAERKAREREDRKQLFAMLRDNGITPEWDTPTRKLREMASQILSRPVTPNVTEHVTPVTPLVTAKTGTGTGTGNLVLPLSDDNGLGDPQTEAAETLPDPEKIMFDGAIALLRSAGKPEAKARSIAGKWKRDHGAEAVIAALAAAKREGAVEPVAFIEACLARRSRDDRDLGGAVPIGMPC